MFAPLRQIFNVAYNIIYLFNQFRILIVKKAELSERKYLKFLPFTQTRYAWQKKKIFGKIHRVNFFASITNNFRILGVIILMEFFLNYLK